MADGHPDQSNLQKAVGMAVSNDDEVTLRFRVEREFIYTDSVANTAKRLGIPVARLRKYLTDDDDTVLELVTDKKLADIEEGIVTDRMGAVDYEGGELTSLEKE